MENISSSINNEKSKLSTLIPIFLLGFLIFIASTYYLRSHDFSVDDAYITFRYAENLRNGLGFVYNQGETTFGTTAPFYAVVLAILSILFPNTSIPAISIILSTFSLICIAYLGYLIARNIVGEILSILFSLLLMMNPWFHNTIGLETLFVIALVLGGYFFYSRGKYLAAGLILGIAIITRSDAIIAAGVIALDFVIRNRRIPLELGFSILVIFAIWSIYALISLGTVIPNTLGVKMLQGKSGLFGDDYLIGTWTKFIQVLFASPSGILMLILGAFGFGFLVHDRSNLLIIILWGLFHWIGYSLLNVPAYNWYYAQLIPAIELCSVYGVWGLGKYVHKSLNLRLSRTNTSYVLIDGILMLLGAILIVVNLLDFNKQINAISFNREKAYQEVAFWIKDNSIQKDTIGAVEVGAIGFFSERRIIDFMGLITPEVGKKVASFDLSWAFENYLPNFVIIHGAGWPNLETPFINSVAYKKLYDEVYIQNSANYQAVRVFKRNVNFALVIKAEDMNIQDPRMKNPGFVNLFTNATIDKSILVIPGHYNVDVIASGSSAFGEWPQMDLYLDHQLIGSTHVTSGWGEYNFVANFPTTNADLSVGFSNDASDPKTGEDRNLLINKVIISQIP